MSGNRWRQVEDIFQESEDISVADRQAWLRIRCQGDEDLLAEVSSLLESEAAAAGQFMEGAFKRAIVDFHDGEREATKDRRIGTYRVVRELGRGGMGTVFLAERADGLYQGQVAIKLIRPGMDTEFILRRFRRERQILARLQHPNIARLLDGGNTDDGAPYLVMEYIDGSWITDYCRIANLSVEDRLRIFLQVCSAVECAHRNFVVHRDLKPGNILVDRNGSPKLLDFGISKLLISESSELTDLTQTREHSPLTPDYASPEQIQGDAITTASDIYSLGAVLYELLTGARPHRIDRPSPSGIEKAICVEDIIPPSLVTRQDKALSRRLAGDVDNILLRAMQKEPGRRYGSVEHFATDISRHLNFLPVEARPDTLFYRGRKFLRRNRVVALASSVVGISLLAGTLVTMHQARIAKQRFEQVRRLASTFVFDVDSAAKDLPGSIPLRRLIVKTGLEYLDNLALSSSGDVDLQRELSAAYRRIGDVQGGPGDSNIGDSGAALISYDKSHTLLDAVAGRGEVRRSDEIEHLVLLAHLADLQSYTADSRKASATVAEAIALAEKNTAKYPADNTMLVAAADVFLVSARVERDGDDLRKSLENATRGLKMLERIQASGGENINLRRDLAAAYSNLGVTQNRIARNREALLNYRKAVAELEELCRLEPVNTRHRRNLMFAYSHIGDVLGNPSLDSLNDPAGALESYGKMLTAAKILYAADPSDMRAVGDYGIALMRVGNALPLRDASKRLQIFEESLEVIKRASRADPKNTMLLVNIAFLDQQIGDTLAPAGENGAAPWYQDCLETAELILARDPTNPSATRLFVTAGRKSAEGAARSGNRKTALATVARVVDLAEKTVASAPQGFVGVRVVEPRAYATAGSIHSILGQKNRQDKEEAARWYEKCLASWKKLEGQPGFSGKNRGEMQVDLKELSSLRARFPRSLTQ